MHYLKATIKIYYYVKYYYVKLHYSTGLMILFSSQYMNILMRYLYVSL